MFLSFRLSTIRFINTNKAPAHTFVDWDAGAGMQELPAGDLIGLNGFSLMNRGKFHEINFGVTFAVSNDPNSFRISNYVNSFYSLMKPEQGFLLYAPTTVDVVGKALFVEGAAIHPVSRFESRICQSVQARCLLTLTG